ncbi:MAG: sodium:alanine symporter family protein [Lentisphaeria bacterium]|nr:sodium:alanine symporter family protein [Lentisphaeria bacterium]
MKAAIDFVNHIVWGAPALVLILGVGLYLCWRLHFAQLLLFPQAVKHFVRQFLPGGNGGGESSFRCLCAALNNV